MKRKLLSLLQLTVAIGLIVLLFYRMDNKQDLLNALQAIAANWPWMLAAIATFGICITMCAWRWKMIMDDHDIRMSYPLTAKFYLIGQFFNAFMPGSVGGDVIKAVYVARQFPDKKTVAVTTIFIDRLIGVITLLLLVDMVVLLRLPFFWNHQETRAVVISLGAISSCALVALFLVFRRNLLPHPQAAGFLKLHGKIDHIIGKIGHIINMAYSAFQDCLTHRRLMAKTSVISLVNHIALIFAAFFLGLGLDIRTTVPPEPDGSVAPLTPALFVKEAGTYLTVFPVIDGIAAIPATPGGLGTREYSTQLLLGMPKFNVPPTRAIPLSLLLYIATLIWSLGGGVVYAVHVIRGGTGIPIKDLASVELDLEADPEKQTD